MQYVEYTKWNSITKRTTPSHDEYWFLHQKRKNAITMKQKTIKTIGIPGNRTQDLWYRRQPNVSSVVKLFNCFKVMHRNVNKQNQNLRVVVSSLIYILTCMETYNYVAVSPISAEGFTAVQMYICSPIRTRVSLSICCVIFCMGRWPCSK